MFGVLTERIIYNWFGRRGPGSIHEETNDVIWHGMIWYDFQLYDMIWDDMIMCDMVICYMTYLLLFWAFLHIVVVTLILAVVISISNILWSESSSQIKFVHHEPFAPPWPLALRKTIWCWRTTRSFCKFQEILQARDTLRHMIPLQPTLIASQAGTSAQRRWRPRCLGILLQTLHTQNRSKPLSR